MTSFPRRLDQALLLPVARGYRRLTRGRPRPRALTITAYVVVTAALVGVAWQANRAAPAVDTSVGQVVRVGVAQGASIPGYLADSRADLAAFTADTPAYALVSLTAYLAPDRVVPVLAGLTVVDVYVRVPLKGTQTEIVMVPITRLPQDLTGGMERIAARKLREAQQYRDQLSRATEPQLAEVYSAGARIADAEATAYADNCSCAYAAVVRATAAELRELAQRDGVRAVDPAPEVRRLDRAVFLPPLPDQRDRAVAP